MRERMCGRDHAMWCLVREHGELLVALRRVRCRLRQHARGELRRGLVPLRIESRVRGGVVVFLRRRRGDVYEPDDLLHELRELRRAM